MFSLCAVKTYGQRQANLVLIAYASSEGSGEPAHPRSLAQNLRCSLIQAVSQEEPSDRKPDLWPLWMAGHAQLKFVMTECSKTQNRLTGLICGKHTVETSLKSSEMMWYFFRSVTKTVTSELSVTEIFYGHEHEIPIKVNLLSKTIILII